MSAKKKSKNKKKEAEKVVEIISDESEDEYSGSSCDEHDAGSLKLKRTKSSKKLPVVNFDDDEEETFQYKGPVAPPSSPKHRDQTQPGRKTISIFENSLKSNFGWG